MYVPVHSPFPYPLRYPHKYNSFSPIQIVGLKTNIRFLDDLAKHPEFGKGNVNTDFIPQYEKELFPERGALNDQTLCRAVLALVLFEQRSSSLGSLEGTGKLLDV